MEQITERYNIFNSWNSCVSQKHYSNNKYLMTCLYHKYKFKDIKKKNEYNGGSILKYFKIGLKNILLRSNISFQSFRFEVIYLP